MNPTNFSPAQKRLIEDFRAHLGIDPKEISLDESGDLFFSLDALNIITIRLAPDILNLSILNHVYHDTLGIVDSFGAIFLADNRQRNCVKSAQVTEPIPGGKIETMIQAANIADGRAARALLRAVGFDPVREFEAFLHHQTLQREESNLPQAEKDRRFIHKVRDDLDMDEATYRQHLSTVSLGKQTSTEDMNDHQLATTAAYFRGLAIANDMQRHKAA